MAKDDTTSFLVRAPKRLFKALKSNAQKQEISLNKLCIKLLDTKHYSHDITPILSSGSFAEEINKYLEDEILPSFADLVVGVVLFGSAARGTMRLNSDVDLLIVLKEGVRLDRDYYSKLKFKTINGHVVSPIIVSLQPSDVTLGSIWIEASLDGCILFDTEFKIARRFANLRSKILSGELVRNFSYGVPYWTHKQQGEVVQ